MSIEDPLTDSEKIEMAYRRTFTTDPYPRNKSRRDGRESHEKIPRVYNMAVCRLSRFPPEVLQEHDTYVTQVMSMEIFVWLVAEKDADIFRGVVIGLPSDGDCGCN